MNRSMTCRIVGNLFSGVVGIILFSLCLAHQANADWPLRDKDLRGSRWAEGATVAVSLDSYTNRWEIPGADSVLVGDVLGDDKREVVTRTPAGIKILDTAGNELRTIAIGNVELGCLADVDGDGKNEILVGKREDDNSLSIYVFKGNGTQLKKLSVEGSGQPDQSITPLFVADIDGDNQLEVVSAGDSGYAIQWRGLEATSLSTGNRKWRVDVGPTTTWDHPTRLGDLDGNGSLKIVQGSGGPANGRIGADGSVDDASYTWLYSAATGAADWRRQYDCCGFFDSSVFLPDLNGDGQPDVVVTTREHGWTADDFGVGTIRLLDPSTGSDSTSLNFGHLTEYGVFGDLDGVRGDEIVIMTYEGTTGYLRAYGANLMPKGSYSRAGGQIQPMGICDLTGDGSPEILAVFRDASGARNDKLLILNATLTQVLREIDLGEHDIRDVIVSDVDGDGRVEILATLTDKVVVLGAPIAKVALVNPDHYRILKHGWKEEFSPTDLKYLSIANASVPDISMAVTNPAVWTGVGTSEDYLTGVLKSHGYQVDLYDSANFPKVTKADYQLVIVQDPMNEVARQFDPSVESNEPDLLQYTTNRTFLARLDSYFKDGGSVILVGDAVRLLENGSNRLNYGKQIVARNAANSVTQPSPLIPSHWLFIRGNPFCCLDRSGSGTYLAQGGDLAPSGAVLASISLFDGNDLPRSKVWSDTVYSPADAVSLLDVGVKGSGEYVLDGSICDPAVYQESVDYEYPNFMGYTQVKGRKIFYIGSDSFFDFQFRNYDGAWHCGQYTEIKNQIGAGGVNAILGLVETAIESVSSDSDGDGVPDSIDQCPNTPAGAIVNCHGCSINQLVPCDGPASGGQWKNHGQYVRAVVKTATQFLKAKLITRRQWVEIVTRAAHSKCGWNRRCDHDGDRDWHRGWDCDRDADWGRDHDRD